VVVQTGKHQIRFLARLLPYPCQIRSHCFSAPCIALVFLLSRSMHRGDLRSAGISRFIARLLQLSGPHHSRRGHLTHSFYIARDTRVLPLRLIPQELLDRRSPGYLPAVVRLDAVLDPGVSASHSSFTRSPHGLRPAGEDRHAPKINGSRGYGSDSGRHPSPRCTRLFVLAVCTAGHYTTERLTKPYSGGPVRIRAPSLSTGNHCQVTPAYPWPKALYRYSLRWFEACSCKPAPRGLPSSLVQLRTLYIKSALVAHLELSNILDPLSTQRYMVITTKHFRTDSWGH
jgi:hypothetical protein